MQDTSEITTFTNKRERKKLFQEPEYVPRKDTQPDYPFADEIRYEVSSYYNEYTSTPLLSTAELHKPHNNVEQRDQKSRNQVFI